MFKISEKPSQKHKIRVHASLSPLSLYFYGMLSKCANSQDPDDRRYAGYIHIHQERIFNPCMNLLDVSIKIEMNLSERKYRRTLFQVIWVLITCNKGSDEPAQMCILNTALSVTHIPASTQSRATIDPPAKCHSNGGSMAFSAIILGERNYHSLDHLRYIKLCKNLIDAENCC